MKRLDSAWIQRQVYDIMAGNVLSREEFCRRLAVLDGKNPQAKTCWPVKPSARDMPGPGNVVYFVQGEAETLVKIGTTSDFAGRIAGLQTGNGHPLRTLGWLPGGRTEEARVHRLFANERRHGEWFFPSKRLLAFIEDSCEPWSNPKRSPSVTEP